jgi:hypothetical protein
MLFMCFMASWRKPGFVSLGKKEVKIYMENEHKCALRM